MDGHLGGWTDGQIDRLVDRKTEGQTNEYMGRTKRQGDCLINR